MLTPNKGVSGRDMVEDSAFIPVILCPSLFRGGEVKQRRVDGVSLGLLMEAHHVDLRVPLIKSLFEDPYWGSTHGI